MCLLTRPALKRFELYTVILHSRICRPTSGRAPWLRKHSAVGAFVGSIRFASGPIECLWSESLLTLWSPRPIGVHGGTLYWCTCHPSLVGQHGRIVKPHLDPECLPFASPANTRRGTNDDLMLGHRRRRWPNIKPSLARYILFATD